MSPLTTLLGVITENAQEMRRSLLAVSIIQSIKRSLNLRCRYQEVHSVQLVQDCNQIAAQISKRR